jgi:demethylmenaquinone methyltransferase/2-methoxy-6-polyprenyl-1,4-benzoquinol methylase
MNYKIEKISPFTTNNEHKAAQVEKMFDDIAPKYDLLNRIMSLGIDKHWRKIGIKKLIDKNPQKILDIATGTGDLAITANKLLNPKQIIGIDISEKMIEIAQKKINSLSLFTAQKTNVCWQR